MKLMERWSEPLILGRAVSAADEADGTVERPLILGRAVSAADGAMGRTPVSGAHCVSCRWGGLLLVERTVPEFPVERTPVSGAH